MMTGHIRVVGGTHEKVVKVSCNVPVAEIVGQEKIIAGTDCGVGGRVHPQIAWAKLRALRDGAAIASKKWS
jgi:methionine synthase II (cobalamin-independent)